nr:GntR family transcriptional regulator [Streptomyces spiramenti]
METEFAVGQVLPNERELAARFGVARATLRQALEQLELEGRLHRRRGVGTTVAPPRTVVEVGASPDAWPGAPGDDWQVTGRTRGLPPLTVARLLGTAPGELVETVHRDRGGDGRPVAVELLHVPQPRLGLPVSREPAGGAATEDIEEGRRVLRRLHRFALDGLDRSVELGSATDEDAGRLGRLPGAPVLVVTSQYVVAGQVAAVGVATYRADTCRLTIGDRHTAPTPH